MARIFTRRELLRDATLTAAVAGALTIVPSTAFGATPRYFYVATNGNDKWSGRLKTPNASRTDGPFATLARARDAIRTLKAAGPLTTPVEVRIQGGTYYLSDTLVLETADSGTQQCPITWRSEPGQQVVISGGRKITSPWTKNGDVYSTTIAQPWKFQTLFVDGRREAPARFPKYNQADPGKSYIYVGGQNPHMILAGIARGGDFIEYRLTVPATDTYDFWLGVATLEPDNEQFIKVEIDGQNVPLSAISGSSGYRAVKYSKAAASLNLSAGEHRLRIESTTPPGGDHRVHLDALVFTTNQNFAPVGFRLPPIQNGERRIVIQAEDESATVDRFSSITFLRFAIMEQSSATVLHVDPAMVKESWANDPEAVVDAVTVLQYYNERVPISAVSATAGTVTVARQRPEAFQAGNYFFISNAREELSAPGEFYLDSSTGRLDFIPRDGKDPNAANVVAPKLTRLIVLRGDATGTGRVRWVTLRGLTFSHCATSPESEIVSPRSPTDGAIQLDCAWNCTIEDCHITGVDGYGIWLHLDSCENTIQRNEIDDIGTGGVLLSPAQLDYGIPYDTRKEVQEFAPLRNAFLRNEIHHGGKTRVIGAGFNLGSRPTSKALSAGNLIAFNHIHHMKRQGVFGFRNQGGNIIAYNYVHDVVTDTADAGALNIAMMTNIASANLIRNNVIRNAWGLLRFGEKEFRAYGVGLYPDHSSSHFWFENNSVVGASYISLVNGGQFNTFFNNIMAADVTHEEAKNYLSDYDGVSRANKSVRNVYASLTDNGFVYYVERLLATAEELIIARPQLMLTSDRNLMWNGGRPISILPHVTLERWRAAAEDVHSVVADPLFVNPAQGNYDLRPESPAFDLGFEAISTTNVGPKGQAELPPITSMKAVHVSSAASTVDSRTTTFTLNVAEDGLYRVYARRDSKTHEPQKLSIVVRHADGESRSVYSEWNRADRNPEPRFGIYVGTYPLKAGIPGLVTFFQPGTAQAVMPTSMDLIRVPRLANSARGQLWEVAAAVPQSRLTVGQRTKVAARGLHGDGSEVNLTRVRKRFSSDAPGVARVDADGTVTAVANGLARITTEVTIGAQIVESDPVTVVVGRILWEATLTAQPTVLRIDETAALAVSARDDRGEPLPLSGVTVKYTTDAPDIATVDADGTVTAHARGSATITADVSLDNVTLTTTVQIGVIGEPKLRYRFDESGTEPAADSGVEPAALGVFHGAARRTSITPSGSGSALDLTAGGAAYVTPGVEGSRKVDGLSAFTIAFWLNLRSDPAANDRLVSKGSALDWFVVGGTANSVSTLVQIGSRSVRPQVFDASDWQFLALVGANGKLTVYSGSRNSAVQVIAELAGAGSLPASVTAELRIGSTSLTTADRTPPAYVDDVTIYDVGLPADLLDRLRTDAL